VDRSEEAITDREAPVPGVRIPRGEPVRPGGKVIAVVKRNKKRVRVFTRGECLLME